jgi:SAM-dependent methyltransferase
VRAEASAAGALPRPWPGWCCSYCAAPLEARDHGLYCAAEDRFFATDAGVHRLLPQERRRELLPRVELSRRAACAERPAWSAARRAEALERTLRIAWDRLGPGPWRALDAGAGTGWASARLLRAAHRPVAVDVDLDPELGLRAAAPLVPTGARLPRAEADIEALPLEPGSFDLVLAVNVLHLVPALARVLIELRRVTRKGGLLVAFDSPVYRWRADGEARAAERRREQVQRLGFSVPREAQEGYLALEDLEATFREAGWALEVQGWAGPLRERLEDLWGRVRRGRVPARRPLLVAGRDG